MSFEQQCTITIFIWINLVTLWAVHPFPPSNRSVLCEFWSGLVYRPLSSIGLQWWQTGQEDRLPGEHRKRFNKTPCLEMHSIKGDQKISRRKSTLDYNVEKEDRTQGHKSTNKASTDGCSKVDGVLIINKQKTIENKQSTITSEADYDKGTW